MKEEKFVFDEIEDPDTISKGDMPGDRIMINPDHIRIARLIFPGLMEQVEPVLRENPYRRAVVAVCGGSGVGKSEIASLISHYLNRIGIGSYTLSGDNYPRRIPKYNDAERLRIFRQSGIKGLISAGLYNGSIQKVLQELQTKGEDSNPEYGKIHSWLLVYQCAGRGGLRNYLGTAREIDFDELTGIISQFKNGAAQIYLKRMGREETELWYDYTDFSDKNVMVIEWTHGNSHNLLGVDIPILLASTPQETLEHRKNRNRDGGVDSPFTAMVLEIEQELLVSQASRAKQIVSKSGDMISCEDYARIMSQAK